MGEGRLSIKVCAAHACGHKQ